MPVRTVHKQKYFVERDAVADEGSEKKKIEIKW